MDVAVPLILRFIALIFFIGMTENLVEFLTKTFHKTISDYFAFLISAVLAYIICFLGDFRFFEALDVHFLNQHIDYVMSALVIAAGSGFLQRKFDIINTIPSVISGVQVASARRKINKEKTEKVVREVEENPVDWDEFY